MSATPIDQCRIVVYNMAVTLSRATEVTGPVKSQQPERNESKVLIPAVYPEDEDIV